MGLLTSAGIGFGAAARAAQPFILNMQQAEIQKLRDDRMAEIAQNTAKYAADLAIENEPRMQAAKLPGLLAAKKAENDLQYSPETIAGEKALNTAKHIEPIDRGAGLRNEQTKAAKLSNEQAQLIANKRDEWISENDPAKKARLAEEYQTLTGKDSDRFAPVMGKDDAGNSVFLGSFDTKNNRFTSASDLSGKGGERMVIAPDGTKIPESQVAEWRPKPAPAVQPASTKTESAPPRQGRDVTPYVDKLQMLMDRQPSRSAPQSEINKWNAELVALKASNQALAPKTSIGY